MATYSTTVATALSPDAAFAYVADFRNAAEWDPGVSTSEILRGGEPGLGAVYAVEASGAEFEYTTTEFDVPRRTVLDGTSRFFHSIDVITVEPDDASGSRVTYRAELQPEGFAKLIGPVLSLMFDRIGDRAAKGLAEALDGRIID